MPNNGVPALQESPDMFDPIKDALEDFKQGRFLVVLDDVARENEGDLIIAAQNITTEQMAFLIKHSSGYVCAPASAERLEALDIPMMVSNNTEKHRTAYTVTIDSIKGTTTGISAHDRALSSRKLADPNSKPDDFNRPGHLVPLRAMDGGVLTRRGHTEAAVDLCRLTGQEPVGIICELVKPDDETGSMARRDDCYAFAKKHGIKMITIDQIVDYRTQHSQ